jgi:predicted amidohydrolase
MKYRICGLQVETGREPEKNRSKVFDLCRTAARSNPDFILFPEMFGIVVPSKEAHRYAQTIPSPMTDEIGRLAGELRVNIVAGTLFEREGERIYNTAVVFDRRGTMRGTYRKMHLFDAFHYNESEGITRGRRPLFMELDGLSFGVAVCYDVRFPELFRHYALQGAGIVFVPSAFFQPNHDHWQLAIRSRALDNGIFVMGCNQTGKRFVGRTMAADPWGVTAGSMGVEEGILTVDMDLDLVEAAREKLPLLQNRRYDVRLRNR